MVRVQFETMRLSISQHPNGAVLKGNYAGHFGPLNSIRVPTLMKSRPSTMIVMREGRLSIWPDKASTDSKKVYWQTRRREASFILVNASTAADKMIYVQ